MSVQEVDYESEMSRPEWLPDEYNPDASLGERLKAISKISGSVELDAEFNDSTTEVLGCPMSVVTNDNGMVKLMVGQGSDPHNHSYEVIAPESDGHPTRLEKVDLMKPPGETVEYTKEDIDVRIYGVDAKRWLDR